MSAPRPGPARRAVPHRAPLARRFAAVVLVAVAAMIAVLSGVPGDSRSAARRDATPATLPAGAGKAIAERSCIFCHSAMLITQQAKDSTGWEKSLATMEKWGAPLTPADHDSLRGYLLAHFGPRSAAK